MRIIRSFLTALLALALGLGLLAGAVTAPAQAATKPERVITLGATKQINYNTFKITGNVLDYPSGKVLLIRKKCLKCTYTKVKGFKTRDNGNFSVRFVAPQKGRWFYKVKVKGDDLYRATTSVKFGAYFR